MSELDHPDPVLLVMPTHAQIRHQEINERAALAVVTVMAFFLTVIGVSWCAFAVSWAFIGEWVRMIGDGITGLLTLALGVGGLAARRKGYLSHSPDGSECVLHAARHMEATRERIVAAVGAREGEEEGRHAQARLLLMEADACEELAGQLRERAAALEPQYGAGAGTNA